jgi:hypothetical protein
MFSTTFCMTGHVHPHIMYLENFPIKLECPHRGLSKCFLLRLEIQKQSLVIDKYGIEDFEQF